MKTKRLLITSIIVIFFLKLTTAFGNDYIKEWNGLTDWQKRNAIKIFNRAKLDNLEYTATAIAWKESSFGLYQINYNTNYKTFDCGIWQNNTRSVAGHLKQTHNHYNGKALCTDLIRDEFFAYKMFVSEIELWKKVHKGSWDIWNKVWSSYNGGHKGNDNYSKDIAKRIKALKVILSEYSI